MIMHLVNTPIRLMAAALRDLPATCFISLEWRHRISELEIASNGALQMRMEI